MLICSAAERSIRSMKLSPAISSEKRVHRWQSTHRSRSRSTCEEMLIGFSYVRLMSWNRVSVRPVDIAWFCSGHSPPLSHIGQSRGWLIRRNSMIPSCAFLATSEVSWVLTTMPSATAWVHEATGLRCPSMSTRHCRQAPAGASSGWSQKRGMAMPSRSATRITSSPLAASTSTPSMVSLTVSLRFATSVTSVRSHQMVGRGQHRWCPALDVVQVVLLEVLDRGLHRAGRAVAERAERPAEQVVAGVQQGVEVLVGALAGQDPVQHLGHPVVALPAGSALAARLVVVELDPPVRGVDRAVLVREDLHRRGTEHGAPGGPAP